MEELGHHVVSVGASFHGELWGENHNSYFLQIGEYSVLFSNEPLK